MILVWGGGRLAGYIRFGGRPWRNEKTCVAGKRAFPRVVHGSAQSVSRKGGTS